MTLNWISYDHVAALLEAHLLPLSVGAVQLQASPEAVLAESPRCRARPPPREEIPADVDAYVFKNILGMNDEDAVVVLANLVKTARAGAHVIIIENFVDDGPGQKFSTGMDLRMLLTVGGRKHTRQGLLGLVEGAGLVVHDVRPVNSYQHMIEATTPA